MLPSIATISLFFRSRSVADVCLTPLNTKQSYISQDCGISNTLPSIYIAMLEEREGIRASVCSCKELLYVGKTRKACRREDYSTRQSMS